jgi:site-specific DNA-cytosine methylase
VAGTLGTRRRHSLGDGETMVAAPLVSRSSRGNAQGNSPGHNADAVIAFHATQDPIHHHHHTPALSAEPSGALAVGVRRLTPTECERLQGFPDGWTQLGDTADSRRYSALGDAVTVSVAEWIGARLRRKGTE